MVGVLEFVLSLNLYHYLAGLLGLFIIYSFIPARRKDVSKEIILITGAGSGIGRQLSIKFARLGATIVLWDINKSANDAVAQEINCKTPNKAFPYQCDCSKREEVYKVAEQVKKDVGDVTILINNAGVVSGKNFKDTPDDKIELTFKVNSIAHFWVSHNSKIIKYRLFITTDSQSISASNDGKKSWSYRGCGICGRAVWAQWTSRLLCIKTCFSRAPFSINSGTVCSEI